MTVDFHNVSKRYTSNWIIKEMSFSIGPERPIGISGPNGSGKSTLLQMISGYLSPTSGRITHSINTENISKDKIYKQVTIAAPYMELLEEFSLLEFFKFIPSFGKYKEGISIEEELTKANLWKDRHKFIKHCSSGMKQKVRLMSAILQESELLLLDEPTSFLDDNAKAWCYQLIHDYGKGRLCIIASNEKEDLALCNEVMTIPSLTN